MTQDTPDWLSPAIRINPSADLAQPVAAGAGVVTVNDTSGFRVGDPVAVTGQGAGGQQTYVGFAIDGLTATQVTLSGTIPQALSLPGEVVAFPSVIVQPASGTPGVPVVLQQLASGLVLPVRPAPFGWQTNNPFSPGQTPSLGEGPGTGTRLVVTYLRCDIVNTATSTQSNDLTLSGATSGIQWRSHSIVPGTVGAVDRIEVTGISYQFAVNEVVTFALAGALNTGVFGYLDMAGYVD